MVWYPTVNDLVFTNIMCLDLTADRHPHKLIGSVEGLQAIVDEVRAHEANGPIHQSAILMQRLVKYHPFEGGNHRTAYTVAKLFLKQNGRRFHVDRFETAYPFIKGITSKTLDEIQRWIEHGTAEEPQ